MSLVTRSKFLKKSPKVLQRNTFGDFLFWIERRINQGFSNRFVFDDFGILDGFAESFCSL
jgi:hypothetical protein